MIRQPSPKVGLLRRFGGRGFCRARTLVPLLMVMLFPAVLLLGACASPQPTLITAITPPPAAAIGALPTSFQFPLPPSVTPLFSGNDGGITAIPYGARLPGVSVAAVGTAQPAPSGGVVVQPNTPYIAPTQVAGVVSSGSGVSGQNAGLGAQAAQQATNVAIPTATTNAATAAAVGTQIALGTTVPVIRTPGNVTVTIPVGQIANTTQNIFTVVINGVVSIFTGAWALAGQYGGQLGQVVCCVVPIAFVAGYLFNRYRRGGRRRS